MEVLILLCIFLTSWLVFIFRDLELRALQQGGPGEVQRLTLLVQNSDNPQLTPVAFSSEYAAAAA